MTWWRRISNAEQVEQELDAELRFDYEQRVAENIRSGMSESEARRAARLEFGGLEQIKEECRDARGIQFLHSLFQDVRYAFRGMQRAPGFTAVAVLTLALGIGVNAAVFTITNAVIFKGFPHLDPDNRILYLSTSKNGSGGTTSYPDFEDWRAQAKSFTGMAVVSNGGLRPIISDENGAPETYDGTELSANSFKVLGQKPTMGRDFMPSDEAPDASPVVMLSYGLWESRYGKDASVIGRRIHINDRPATVIGVMPAGFDFPHHRVDLWVPLMPASRLQKRDARLLWFVFGRRADGVTILSAQAEMDIIGRRLESSYPLTNQGFRPRVRNFRDAFIGPNAAVLYGSLWGAVGFVLLIACANLANFLLARAIGRSREVSVRIALGAGRRRIVRQLLIESLMLSSLGGAFGWLAAMGSVRAYELLEHFPGSYDRWRYSLDYSVFFYVAAISIVTGLLFGMAPTITLSKLDANTTLKDGGRGATSGGRRKRLAALLVTVEMALALVLLAGAGVMIRSFLKIYTADLGVRAANILTVSVWLPAAGYPRAQEQIAFFERLKMHLNAIPGVNSLALADSLPGLYAPRLHYELAGAESIADQSRPTVSSVIVGSGYFRTVGATVLSGREFNDFDGASGMPVAIVNQRFASRFWPGEDPLGKRLRLSDGKTMDVWRTVVGVASNIVQNDNAGQTFDPVAYVPFRQRPASAMDLLARTRVPPASLETAFRREIQAMDSELVLYSGLGSLKGPAPLSESLVINNSWSGGFNAALFFLFAAIALLLASVGLYAVIAHSVSRRTQEIGIRMALGATARDIRTLLFLEGMLPVAIGLTIGLAASSAVNRLLRSELVQVSPDDPITLAVASVVLILAAVLGCWIPARRAMRVDSAAALRHE